jgi:hypothetical protein
MEQDRIEQLLAAVREQVAKAHELLEVGEDRGLSDADVEILRPCRELGRAGETSDAIQAVVHEAIDCRIEIEERGDAQRKVNGMKKDALAKMPPEELDSLVEKLVIGRRPQPGILRRIRDSWLQRYTRGSANSCVAYLPRQKVPEYSSSYEGMGLIIEKMQSKGFSVTIEPNDEVRFTRDGKETKYSLASWDVNLPKTVAIAAVFAVQGG